MKKPKTRAPARASAVRQKPKPSPRPKPKSKAKLKRLTPLKPQGLASGTRDNAFPIVAIGASAGGLEAYLNLFRLIPPDTGMAFVLVQHLAPQHLSLLSSLVQKTTRMSVVEVTDGTVIRPNTVYVIPPNMVLEVLHGVLSLQALSSNQSTNRLVDIFFASLARDHQHLAVGVVLSGTGSDGAQGLVDIKANGGISLVQDPKSAKYDGMPKMAIKVDHPDRVLDVAGLVRELVLIARNPRLHNATVPEHSKLTTEDETALRKIFLAVRSNMGTDFSTYKYPTILRRIKRRMILNGVDSLKHYQAFLQNSPTETKTLFSELIINVTHFFRDPEMFDSLKSLAFPEILKDRAASDPIRIWVPGCSTGEEVYSIAMSLIEHLQDLKINFPIQIYGTDVGESIIKKARAGVFTDAIEARVSKERLDRFFVKEDDAYKIGKSVRDHCVFSVQDVTTDPPIHRLDLLSCRNLMIYLGAPAQQRLMETFFYALKPRSYLVLGASESVGPASSYFSVADERNKIYLKRAAAAQPRRVRFELHDSKYRLFPAEESERNETVAPRLTSDPVADAEKIVLESYAPAWMLVNQMMDIVHFNGKTENLIAPRSGQASLHFAKMLREDLVSDVRVVVHKAEKESARALKNNVSVRVGKTRILVDIQAEPVGARGADQNYLVLFYERPASPAIDKAKVPRNSEVARLRAELASTQTSLRSLLEDQSAVNEVLQSTNEEILSANEELQSANEELETAKEELQSTNEELVTVNEELSQRNSDLAFVNDDLSNLLSNSLLAVVMLNSDLLIRRMTPAAGHLLKLAPADAGRKLTDFSLGFPMANLEERLNEVLGNLAPVEFEARHRDGRVYAISIRPFKTHDRRIDGAVISFVDVNARKVDKFEGQSPTTYASSILQAMPVPLVVLNREFDVLQANAAYLKAFKTKIEETIGKSLFEIGDKRWNIAKLKAKLETILPSNAEFRDFRVSFDAPKAGRRQFRMDAQPLSPADPDSGLILLVIHEVTEAS